MEGKEMRPIRSLPATVHTACANCKYSAEMDLQVIVDPDTRKGKATYNCDQCGKENVVNVNEKQVKLLEDAAKTARNRKSTQHVETKSDEKPKTMGSSGRQDQIKGTIPKKKMAGFVCCLACTSVFSFLCCGTSAEHNNEMSPEDRANAFAQDFTNKTS